VSGFRLEVVYRAEERELMLQNGVRWWTVDVGHGDIFMIYDSMDTSRAVWSRW
jgi:hypothetical protein